jgi:hypothetical protein
MEAQVTCVVDTMTLKPHAALGSASGIVELDQLIFFYLWARSQSY